MQTKSIYYNKKFEDAFCLANWEKLMPLAMDKS